MTVEYSAEETHSVWNDSFLYNAKATAIYEDLQSDDPVIKIDGELNYNGTSRMSFTDFYYNGNSYAIFSAVKTKHRDRSDLESFLARQYPIRLFSAENFAEAAVSETADGVRLSFSGASALEEWLVPDYAVLIEASAELTIC